ncbi:MAG: hypothetical protein KA155_02145 [Alphaproteobacteria bacterium]|jgi:hypothetical protein|nr:hypothetical protein [Alphaproteobacteria bacterium]
MTFKKLALAGIFLAPLAFVQPAEAGEYCREYQKSIRVGGHIESGYGTACMQPDGSWMIVSTGGTVDPFDELRRQDVLLISDQRPIYYNYGPSYRPVTYYPRKHHHYNNGYYYGRPNSGLSLSFIFDDDNNRRHHHWDRRDWRDDDRGRGRGRGHGHNDRRHGGRHDRD